MKSEKKLQFEQKQKAVLQLKSEIKQIEQSLNSSVVEIEEQIEQSKNKYIDLLNEEATVKNELKHIEQQLTQQEATAERMSDRSFEMVKRLQTVRQQKQELLEKYQIIEQQLKDNVRAD